MGDDPYYPHFCRPFAAPPDFLLGRSASSVPLTTPLFTGRRTFCRPSQALKNVFVVCLQIHSDTQSFVRHHSDEPAATQAIDTVTGKQDTSPEPLWQCLDAKDGTLVNTDISDVYKRHQISFTETGSEHAMPWYPYDRMDALGSLNVAFGIKSDMREKPIMMENPIHPTVKTEPKSEPEDRRMESADSVRCWQMAQFCSTVDGGDATGPEFDVRPLRAVASVPPTQFTSPAEPPVDNRGQSSNPSISMSYFQPPPPSVVPPQSIPLTTGPVVTPGLPFGGHLLSGLEGHGLHSSSPRGLRSPSGGDDVSDSEVLELDEGRYSPPPERVNREDHRSTNAM